jgi:N-acetylglucosaminyldiphosphoundecaprenol N-acetyl-beta-D-mannosaminyltransferase
MANACSQTAGPGRVWIWGLPLAPLTATRLLDEIRRLIDAGAPSYFITANLNYAMLTSRLPDLQEVNRRAAFVVADGMPLVWASRRCATPLPERVAGSDLIFALSRMAAERGYRVFLLGAGPGVADTAAANLCARYPGLQIVGIEAPSIREGEGTDALLTRIQAARPDLLIVALGQPKGERWIFEHYQALGVPVSVQVGGSLDFAAGRIRRAPRWIQRVGLEWVYRLVLEPRRLSRRYWENGLFLIGQVLSQRSKTRDGDVESSC